MKLNDGAYNYRENEILKVFNHVSRTSRLKQDSINYHFVDDNVDMNW